MSRAPPTIPANLIEKDKSGKQNVGEGGEYEVVETKDRRYVGVMGGEGRPTFVDPNNGRMYAGSVDPATKRVEPADEHEFDLQPGEELGDALVRIGDEVGWESLSDWAETHLKSDEE